MLLDDELRAEWLANIPATLVREDRERRALEPTTKEGVFNRVLAETGDAALAEQAKSDFWRMQKEAEVAAKQGMQPQ